MNKSEIYEVKAGMAFRSRIVHCPTGNITVLQPKDIGDDGVLQGGDLCRVEMDPVKPDRLLKRGDVLLSNRGRFAAAMYDGEIENCIAAGSLLVLTIRDGAEVLPEYLALYLNSEEGRRELGRLDETTTIPYISRKNLEQVDIPIPAMEKQKRLVALEKAKLRFTELAARKAELINGFITHELKSIQ